MLLNSKTFDKWDISDLTVLVENADDFRENEVLDYKESFSFIGVPKEKPDIIQVKKNEFRNDVCAFTNADGGLLVFGISDLNGTPNEIVGIEIPDGDTDRFELDRRNELSTIQPAMPTVKFNFIKLEDNKFVVIIYVEKGPFSPYITKDSKGKFIFYKRQGNGKREMNYNEVRNMFNQSVALSDEIQGFRDRRLNYFLNTENNINGISKAVNKFAILHIIPEQFLNITSNQKMFLKNKQLKDGLSNLFPKFCYDYSIPFVDGLFFPNTEDISKYKVNFFNNGIAELLFQHDIDKKENKMEIGNIIRDFKQFSINYIDNSENFHDGKRIFLCASLYGYQGVNTEYNYTNDYSGIVIGQRITCLPIDVVDVNDKSIVLDAIKNLIVTLCLATGVKNIEKYLASYGEA